MSAPHWRWGWHQLSAQAATRLVAESGISSGDLVLDIGAGLGAITAPLVERGARVIAIEAHPERVAALRERFGHEVVVVRADASDLRLPRRSFHVVANPPFAVTSALMLRLFQQGTQLQTARLVLQDQPARRWASPAAPGWRRWQHLFDVQAGPTLPRRAFHPPPRVNCRILSIHRRHAS